MIIEITLLITDDDGNFLSSDTMKGDNMVGVLAQLPYAVAQVMKRACPDEEDDELPFL